MNQESIKKYYTCTTEINPKSLCRKANFFFNGLRFGSFGKYKEFNNVLSYLKAEKQFNKKLIINNWNSYTPLVELVETGMFSFRKLPFKLDDILEEILNMAETQKQEIYVSDVDEARRCLINTLENKRFIQSLEDAFKNYDK